MDEPVLVFRAHLNQKGGGFGNPHKSRLFGDVSQCPQKGTR